MNFEKKWELAERIGEIAEGIEGMAGREFDLFFFMLHGGLRLTWDRRNGWLEVCPGWGLFLRSFVFDIFSLAAVRVPVWVPVWKKRMKSALISMPWAIPPALLVLWSVVWMFRPTANENASWYSQEQSAEIPTPPLPWLPNEPTPNQETPEQLLAFPDPFSCFVSPDGGHPTNSAYPDSYSTTSLAPGAPDLISQDEPPLHDYHSWAPSGNDISTSLTTGSTSDPLVTEPLATPQPTYLQNSHPATFSNPEAQSRIQVDDDHPWNPYSDFFADSGPNNNLFLSPLPSFSSGTIAPSATVNPGIALPRASVQPSTTPSSHTPVFEIEVNTGVRCNHQDSRRDNLRRHMRLVHHIGNDPAYDKSSSASPKGLATTTTAYSEGNKRKHVEAMDMGDLSREELIKRLIERDVRLMQKENELREERLRTTELEQKLKTKEEKLKEMEIERRQLRKKFSTGAFYHPQNHHHGTSNVRHSYLLEEDLRNFDAQFFGINPVEAHSVDPQQRLLLETVYESLEAAGLSVKELQGSDTAVYVGVMSADFTDMIGRDTEMFPTYFATVSSLCTKLCRLSAGGESSVAVVAGSNLILGPEQYIAESKLQMLSPTGRSRMWDADADGYARGEGVAAIVLKKPSQAIADGDHIECVIRETGLNQDGRTPGITMPSATAQEALIRATYAKAGLDISKRADRPQFFEAHGTADPAYQGTPAGDPVEARAVSNAFFGPESHFIPSNSDDTLFVGSIKTVIGHTEGTAGLAAVIKASLALQAGIVPPNMLLNKVNPKIEPFYGKVQILSTARKWPKLVEGGVRRVSVNSFGFGGANCHAILESFEPKVTLYKQPSSNDATCFAPFLFSAASENSLTARLSGYREYFANGNAGATVKLRDLSSTLSNRRSTLPWRAVVPATNNVEDLIKKLDDCTDFTSEPSSSSSGKTKGSKPRILGIFTGQGAQWPQPPVTPPSGSADMVAS
ncbi:hypothetical protein NUW58_g8811 [Xylaria curta]|uniref:Uncharacterized protein n=1 Tax=Xylaria curta TaxID=42375 RepID=A0ACC1N3W1_9PEZI|nr:hypothetical protein NUW58_g8811 [Xylaria curta]